MTDDAEGDCSLPVRIRTERGTAIAHGILSTTRPRCFDVPDEAQVADASSTRTEVFRSYCSWVLVDVITRQGAVITRRLPLIGRTTQHTIDLVPEDIPDWLMWAAGDVNLAPQARVSFSDTPACHVIGRLWARRLGKCRPVELPLEGLETKEYATQFELTTSDPSVLQLGGPGIPSRFISLPLGRVRILLTANAATRAFGDALNVAVSRLPAGPRNILLSLLSLDESEHLSDVEEELGKGFDWAGVGEDALSGCALGYAALRLRALDRFTLSDARNLFDMARGSPDAAIVFASRAILEDEPDYSQVLRLLNVGIHAGLPVLAQSLSAANSVLNCLRRRAIQIDQKLLAHVTDKAWRYSGALTRGSPFMCFYGSAPGLPGIQQSANGREREVGSGFRKAVAIARSAFKPVSSTTLICADQDVSTSQYVHFGST
ncbi:hypothetical protein [Caballeronia sp. Lep1P3]|uniref:hypothetical protein n=1 Tax=Caballeronia sp. Lep1P3 TaxID=2878150 RepID=UPI001FD3628C|nr:hypothetical protein [Caballeronia sp. Lep1P3]